MITVGQKLYYVPNRNGWRKNRHEVTVTAVGRKWATLDNNERFALTDARMMLDGGQYSSPGRCYLSREDYEAEQLLEQRWTEFAQWVGKHRWGPPAGMTIERIEQAAAILQVEHLPLMGG